MSDADLIRRLALELERLSERHGCGQVECAMALVVVAEARQRLGLRRREPLDTLPLPALPHTLRGTDDLPADGQRIRFVFHHFSGERRTHAGTFRQLGRQYAIWNRRGYRLCRWPRPGDAVVRVLGWEPLEEEEEEEETGA